MTIYYAKQVIYGKVVEFILKRHLYWYKNGSLELPNIDNDKTDQE